MPEIDVLCPYCGDRAHAPYEAAGKNAACANCGKKFRIKSPESVFGAMAQTTVEQTPSLSSHQLKLLPEIIEVVVSDIKMPLGSMVVFMVKWAIAAIPALIILALLGFFVSAVSMRGCAALIMGR